MSCSCVTTFPYQEAYFWDLRGVLQESVFGAMNNISDQFDKILGYTEIEFGIDGLKDAMLNLYSIMLGFTSYPKMLYHVYHALSDNKNI